MAFLDNSGDIILDAVLTDTGRFRLARGDGTFKIAKFALGDDEINYGLYRNANHGDGAHPSGSAYYDLEILQTPILEAFTNNTSMLKSRLLSISRTNLLYLPVLKLNTTRTMSKINTDTDQASGFFVVTVDEDTSQKIISIDDPKPLGTINGFATADEGYSIYIDQGLDTLEITPEATLDGDLIETQYVVEIDNRLGKIRQWFGAVAGGRGRVAVPSFIDDDNIASYYFTEATDQGTFVKMITERKKIGEQGVDEVIRGPRGTSLVFDIAASIDLQQSNFLFSKLGETDQDWTRTNGVPVIKHSRIDTNVRITGLTTGYRLDIPVRFVKYESGG